MESAKTIAQLLTLLVMVAHSSAQSCFANGTFYEANPWMKGTTVAACKAACLAIPSCKYYTYNSVTKNCGVFNFDVGGFIDFPNTQAGLPNNVEPLLNALIVNAMAWAPTLDLCSVACLADSQCQSWTWFPTGTNAQKCFLFYHQPQVPFSSGLNVLSGLRSCVLTATLPPPPPPTTTTTTTTTTTKSTTTTTISTTTTTTKPTTPAPKQSAVVFLGGGFNSGIAWSSMVDSWPCSLPLANLPVNITSGAAAVVKGTVADMIVFCGGSVVAGVVSNCYAFVNGFWFNWQSMLVARNGHTLTMVGTTLVVFGGGDSTGKIFNTAETYAEGGSTWKLVSNALVTSRTGHCAVAASATELIVAGGFGGSGTGFVLTSAEKINIVTGAKINLASMPNAVFSLACTIWNNNLLAVGGTAGGAAFNNMQVYSLSANTWSNGPVIKQARQTHTMDVVNGFPTIFGGTNGATKYNTTEIYNGTHWNLGPTLKWNRFFHAMVQTTCP